jgi:Fe-S oxidoreductase
MMEDKEQVKPITNCAMCANMCKYTCPVYLAAGSETISPQKIARLILYEEKDFLEDRQGFCDVMFQSAMCGACRRHCIYEDYDLRKFIQRGRIKAFQEDMIPPATRKRVEIYREHGNPHGERQLIEKGAGETGHLVSCSAYKDADFQRAVDRIISASGLQISEFGGADICCGAPLYYAGDMEGFAQAAVKMKGEIEKRGLRKVIADCPNCLRMMTQVYHEVDVELDVEFVHTTEFLVSLMDERILKIKKREGTATYHDPCILANDFGVTEAPRKIISALGLDIKEPVYSREFSHCCGGPGGARIGDSELADKVSSMRVNELQETSVDVYVTSCLSCKSVLSSLDIKDLTELVAEQIADE